MRAFSFVIDQLLRSVFCLSASTASSSLSASLFLLVFVCVGERLAAVVDHCAGEVHLDGEHICLLQDGVAVIVVM